MVIALFGPTFFSILRWNISSAAAELPSSAVVPIHEDEQDFFDTDCQLGIVVPKFVEIYPFALTDDTAAMIGRAAAYGEDIAQASQVAAILSYLVHAYEEYEGGK